MTWVGVGLPRQCERVIYFLAFFGSVWHLKTCSTDIVCTSLGSLRHVYLKYNNFLVAQLPINYNKRQLSLPKWLEDYFLRERNVEAKEK